jgi:hypothetical protein
MSHQPDAASQQMIDTALRLITSPYATERVAREVLDSIYQLGVIDGKQLGFERAAEINRPLLETLPPSPTA